MFSASASMVEPKPRPLDVPELLEEELLEELLELEEEELLDELLELDEEEDPTSPPQATRAPMVKLRTLAFNKASVEAPELGIFMLSTLRDAINLKFRSNSVKGSVNSYCHDNNIGWHVNVVGMKNLLS